MLGSRLGNGVRHMHVNSRLSPYQHKLPIKPDLHETQQVQQQRDRVNLRNLLTATTCARQQHSFCLRRPRLRTSGKLYRCCRPESCPRTDDYRSKPADRCYAPNGDTVSSFLDTTPRPDARARGTTTAQPQREITPTGGCAASLDGSDVSGLQLGLLDTPVFRSRKLRRSYLKLPSPAHCLRRSSHREGTSRGPLGPIRSHGARRWR